MRKRRWRVVIGVWLALATIAVVLLGVCAVLYHLTRQHGRVLLRLEALEEQDEHGLPPEDGRAGGGVRTRSTAESRIRRDGLRVGAVAPDFALPGLREREVSLSASRGRQLLLVFSDPACSPCNELVRRLAAWHRTRGDDRLDVLMISRGDLELNRRKAAELAVDFPVGVQPGWRISKAYEIFATPAAFLIDEDGVIASPVALGAEAILRLAAQANGARSVA